MSIPVSYTNATFSDYLKDEVLIDTSLELGWLDISTMPEMVYVPPAVTPLVDEATDDNTFKLHFVIEGTSYSNNTFGLIKTFDGKVLFSAVGNGTVTRGLVHPLRYAIPAGTVMSIGDTNSASANGYNYASGIVNRTLASDAPIGATSITFTTSLTDSGGLLSIGYWYNGGVLPVAPAPNTAARVQNPVYQSIIDSTLVLLGETDITFITGHENIKKLRLFGRRETWKFAMQTLAADYTYSTNAGNSGRSDVYAHCKQIYLDEDFRVSQMYGEAREQSMKNSQYFINTTRSNVKVRW